MLYGLNRILPLLLKQKKNSLNILIYHRVMPSWDYMRPDEPTVTQFSWQIELISRYMTPLSLADALDLMQENKLPKNAVCVTFDDGYADNLTLAAPVLKQWSVPATVYIATDFLDGGIMWNDAIIEIIRNSKMDSVCMTDQDLGVLDLSSQQEKFSSAMVMIKNIKHLEPAERKAIVKILIARLGDAPKDLMLTSKQLIELSQMGIDIGAHTCSHPILASININRAEEEIYRSRSVLESLLEKDITHFAYPNGRYKLDFDDRHVKLVQKLGFSSAVTTECGVSVSHDKRFELKRFTPWDKSPIKYYVRLLLNSRT